ncbi:MAG TPA: hypothetical protein VFN25_16490 [Dokdonella sp.]|uniref:hypothetical protein n=1 Tax=Dokdonella sp. TaxID=2291710 RepID=UPI002D80ADC5|nr:hypothetical protein [Dokdonella sp.]HET9034487.1 hypothetical protein [Dokdonella sp.]
MKSAPSIAFDYRPSRGLAIAMFVVALAAIVAILLSGLPGTVRLLIAPALAALGALALYRHLKSDVVRVARGEGGWLLVDLEGSERPVRLIDHVHRGFLLVLSFQPEAGRVRRLVLTPDNADGELRRRLLLTLAAGHD